MENKEYFKGLDYEGYYDDNGNFYININKNEAEKVLQRLTGVKVIISK